MPIPAISDDGQRLIDEYGDNIKKATKDIAITLAESRTQEYVLASHVKEAFSLVKNEGVRTQQKRDYVTTIGGVLIGLFLESFFMQISRVINGQNLEPFPFLIFVPCGFIGLILISYTILYLKD